MITATYSPEDNKLRLYSATRLDSETYARIKAAGFKWAPKQDLFVAPMWTPGRADLCIELAGEIEDEDTSLVDRQAERAGRFEDYSAKRHADANAARKGVERITSGIPLGQPILVGHHSERHARKDAERIENGMRKAVKMWETSQYWKDRAAGALRLAKYKERPDVRHRRIKGLEADKRKHEKSKANSEKFLMLWQKPDLGNKQATTLANYDRAGGYHLWSDLEKGTMHAAEAAAVATERHRAFIANAERWLAHIGFRLEYERAMLGEDDAAEKFADIRPGGQVLVRGEWVTVIRVNHSGGKIASVTTNARYVRVKGIETVKDYRPLAVD